MTNRAVATARTLRVPEITIYFWVIKALSTAMGEATSDYLVHQLNPLIAVALDSLQGSRIRAGRPSANPPLSARRQGHGSPLDGAASAGTDPRRFLC